MSLLFNGYNNYAFGRQVGAIGGAQIGGALTGAGAWRWALSQKRNIGGTAHPWGPSIKTPFPTLQALALSGLWIAPFNGQPIASLHTLANTPHGAAFLKTAGVAAPTLGSAYNGYRSAVFAASAVDILDRSTLSLSGWWKEYSAPWTGTTSAGTSGGIVLGPAPANPSTGTALNGHATANFVAASTHRISTTGTGGSAQPLSNFFSSTAGSIYILTRPTTLSADPGGGLRFNAPLIVDDDGVTYFQIAAHANGATIAAIGTTAGYTEVTAPGLAASTYALIQAKWDGVDLRIRINGGAWYWLPFDGIAATGLGSGFRMGGGGTAFFNGTVAEVGVSQSVFSDATFDAILASVNFDYGLAL